MVLPLLDPDVIFADSPDLPSESENGSYHCSDSDNCEWGSSCDGNHSYSQSYLDFLEEEEESSKYKKAMAKATVTSDDATKGEEEKTVAESDEGRCPDLEDEGEVAPDSYEGDEGEGEEEPDVDMHVTKPGEDAPDSYLDDDDLWVDEVDLDLL